MQFFTTRREAVSGSAAQDLSSNVLLYGASLYPGPLAYAPCEVVLVMAPAPVVDRLFSVFDCLH